jgi:hypothetical protein
VIWFVGRPPQHDERRRVEITPRRPDFDPRELVENMRWDWDERRLTITLPNTVDELCFKWVDENGLKKGFRQILRAKVGLEHPQG